jgi:hypothetical protein
MAPTRRHAGDRPHARWDRQRAGAAAVFFLGLLLFVWPFVRTPPLSLGLSYAHLLASWALVVAGLYGLARSLAQRPRPGADDA